MEERFRSGKREQGNFSCDFLAAERRTAEGGCATRLSWNLLEKQNGGILLPPFAVFTISGRCCRNGRRSVLRLYAMLRSFAPACQIFLLLGSEAVNLDAHGLQLQAGDLLVQLFRNGIDLTL